MAVAALIGWMGEPSPTLYAVAFGAGMMLLLDYATAHKAALRAGEQIKSRLMREMMAAKLMSYCASFWVMLTIALVLRSWLPVIAILGWITYCETISNLENIRKLAIASGPTGSQFYGGVKRLADKVLGEIPGAEMAVVTKTTTIETKASGVPTATVSHTEQTSVVVAPVAAKEEEGE